MQWGRTADVQCNWLIRNDKDSPFLGRGKEFRRKNTGVREHRRTSRYGDWKS